MARVFSYDNVSAGVFQIPFTSLTVYCLIFCGAGATFIVSCEVTFGLAAEVSVMPIISLSRRALFCSGVSVHLLSPPGVVGCDGAFAPLAVLNFRAFNFVGSIRVDQSLFDGGTIIHSSLWLLLDTCGPLLTDACTLLAPGAIVDVPAPGKLGPKASSSLLVSDSSSRPFWGLSSRLAGGSVGPMVRGRFAEESGVCDPWDDGVGVSEWSMSVSDSSSRFRFTADGKGSWGPTEAIISK